MLAFVLFENHGFASVDIVLVAIPESLALLAFGIGLAALAVLIRSFLTRGGTEKRETNASKKA
jgi:uncharacterized membrane protein YidH (DUF202 family)